MSVNKPKKKSKAVVCIVSGGLDSISTMAYFKKQNFELYSITFSYGQRANLEIEYAKKFSDYLNVKQHKIIDISFMRQIYGDTNVLTDDKQKIPKKFEYRIVAPIRNAIFITIATAWAMSIGVRIIAYGAHIEDNNYPDCRPEFISSINHTLNLGDIDGIQVGLRKKVKIWSPTMKRLDKTKLVKIGYNILGDRIFETWSCYSDGIKIRKEIKKIQCGICESCINRRKAFRNANISDKTRYAN